jgi:hypothetical protein
MAETSDFYALWIGDARRDAKADLALIQRVLDGLQNRESAYCRAVSQMRDARKAVLDVMLAQPDSMTATPTATPTKEPTP